MIQLLCCPNWPHTLWHLYFCSHCSLCLEGIPTSVSDKNLSVLPNLSASDREPFLIYSKFLWSPLPFNSKALCLCLLSGLWKLLKVEDLSRWSDSPLKFHAKFEGMCIRAFFWGKIPSLSTVAQRTPQNSPLPPAQKLRTFMLEKTSENKIGWKEVREKMDEKEKKN